MIYLYQRHQKKKRKRRQIEALGKANNGNATNGDTAATTAATTDVNKEHGAVPPESLEPTEEERHAKSAARKYRWKLIGGLFLPYFIASTDITIIATALPFIASHFNRLNQLNWIVTAFTITSTSFIPVWGQLADVFGRHAVLQSVMVIMMIGAALAAGAQAWVMLLFGRALMGVAAAGILNIIKIVMADKVTLEENAKNNTIFALVGGLSFAIGPVIGGYLTNASWRWCFILNVPVAALAMVSIFVLLRHDLVGPKPAVGKSKLQNFVYKLSTIDFGGLILFVGGVTLIIIGTTWGGSTYAWNSAHVIAPIVIGGILFVGFFFYEHLMEPGNLLNQTFPSQQPMIPLRLFRHRDLPLLAWVTFSTGQAMYSVIYFVGIYFTVAKGYAADKAGIQLLYYLPGIGVGVYAAMFACNIWPKMTWHPIFIGSVLETTGFAVLAWALHSGRVSVIAGMMGLAGAGTGLRLMPETLHVTGIWPNEIARAMSVIDFCIPFGGTIALAMMGAVFNNKLVGALPTIPGGAPIQVNQHNQNSLDTINSLPGPQLDAFRKIATQAIVLSYVAVIPIIALAILAALLLGNVTITKQNQRTDSGRLDTHDVVETRPYLWALLKGGRRSSPAATESQTIATTKDEI